MASRQLLDCGLLVRKPIVTQVAVAKCVIPLGALRIASVIAYLDYYEAELRQSNPVVSRRKRFGYTLGLRTRIYEGNDGVTFRRIKIKGLIHHAVEICDSIISLDLEWLGILKACLHKRGNIGLLQSQDAASQHIVKIRCWRAVYPRGIVHKVLVRIRHCHCVCCVTRIEQLHRTSIEAHTVNMVVIGILPRLLSICGEIHGTTLLVDAFDFVAYKLV